MRQAGRYLPEYRALKEKYSFTEMVKSPELATEVTLQPLKRFPLDAAIIFSDILIIPEALGQPYHFREGGGIGMDYIIDSVDKINALDASDIEEKLAYLPAALRMTREAIGEDKTLLGFGGSPWTLAAYMTEGGSLKDLAALKTLYYSEPATFELLMEKITSAVIDLFKMEIEAGVDALQIFDSAGAFCPASHYEGMSLRWIKRIIDALPADFPIIIFAKGMAHQRDALLCHRGKCTEYRLDQRPAPATTTPCQTMSPCKVISTPSFSAPPRRSSAKETTRLLEAMQGRHGHILNLGHGILPSAKPDNMQVLCDTIAEFAS